MSSTTPLFLSLLLLSLCASANETQTENTDTGTTAWQITNPALNREIEGYASLTSVNVGGSISLFVSTAASTYTMDIFRIGWYGGAGGREMLPTITRTGGLLITPSQDANGMFECNWTNPYVLTIPANRVSGVSTDGVNYATAGSFTQSLNVSAIGLYAWNYNATPGNAPQFNVLVDYFHAM